MIHPSEFGALRAFAAVAEQQSFSRAAEQLGVSSSALSQLIRGLEERLGIRLLHRTTRSVSLTEAGAALLGDIAPAIDSLTGALEQARTAAKLPAGTVRLHCFHAAADRFVVPILPRLLRAFPDITLDLTIDDTVVDIVGSGYDAAIRIGEVIERDMVALRLGEDIRQLLSPRPHTWPSTAFRKRQRTCSSIVASAGAGRAARPLCMGVFLRRATGSRWRSKGR